MTKYFKRIFGDVLSEPLLIQLKIERIVGNFSPEDVPQYQDLHLVWKRGDTTEKSKPFADIIL